MSTHLTQLRQLLDELRAKLDDRLFAANAEDYSLLAEAPTETCLALCRCLHELEAWGITIDSATAELPLEDRYLIELIHHVYMDCCRTPINRSHATELERSHTHSVYDELDQIALYSH